TFLFYQWLNDKANLQKQEQNIISGYLNILSRLVMMAKIVYGFCQVERWVM
ncbi:unnamed protein product, partial [marine sediment metagenome]